MIPFLDLREIQLASENELVEIFKKFLVSGRYILGPELEAFEKEYAAYCGISFCSGVANGLDALVLALKALKIGPGDQVIVPAHTFIATWLAVTQAGAIPIPVDVELDTGNIDVEKTERCIEQLRVSGNFKVKAIVAVHLQGRLCEIEKLKEIAIANRFVLIEDAAQAHGARRNGVFAGAFGDAGCFSFYPGKNLGALGDGGAVTSISQSLNDKIRLLRNYGARIKYHHDERGQNSRLDEIQAAILRFKLKSLDRGNEHRRKLADLYLENLTGLPIILPRKSADESVWHLFTILSPERDRIQSYLIEHGIQTGIHYPIAPFDSDAYREDFASLRSQFPIAARIARETLSLPIGPLMTTESVQLVCDKLTEFFEGSKS